MAEMELSGIPLTKYFARRKTLNQTASKACRGKTKKRKSDVFSLAISA